MSFKRISNFIRKNYFLIIILLLFLALRIPALNQEVFGDELYNYYFSHHTIDDAKTSGVLPEMYPVYFLSVLFYKLAYTIYPSIVSMRLISMLFGLGILLLAMKALESNISKRAAIIFGIIYSVVPWAVFTSVLLDIDGTVNSILFTVLIYFTLRYLKDLKEGKYKSMHFIAIGLISGTLIFAKVATFFSLTIFYAIFLGYTFIYLRKIPVKRMILYAEQYLGGLAISLILLSLIYLLVLGPGSLSALTGHYVNIPANHFSLDGLSAAFIFHIYLITIIISPIIIIFILELLRIVKPAKSSGSLKYNGFMEEKYLAFISIFYAIQLTALLFIYNGASINRYASFLLIPILMLVSIYLSKFFDEKRIIMMTIYALFFSAVYFAIDRLPNRILDFYPQSGWLQAFTHLRWNFLAPVNGAAGPLGFYISFINIVLAFIACITVAIIVVLLLYRTQHSGQNWKVLNSKNIGKAVLILSIIALSYCIYVSMQYSYSITSPSIDSINRQVRTDCAPQGYDSEYFVFRNNAGFAMQNEQGLRYVKLLSSDIENDAAVALQVIHSGKRVCIVDFPQMSKSSLLWNSINENCSLVKTYSSHEYILGYWYNC